MCRTENTLTTPEDPVRSFPENKYIINYIERTEPHNDTEASLRRQLNEAQRQLDETKEELNETKEELKTVKEDSSRDLTKQKHLKLIMLGDQSVGKTCLLKKFKVLDTCPI